MLLEKKLIMVGGKGGVGKTSCAAATSLYTASKGKKTLILSTDPAHSLSDSFGKEIGNKVTKIKDNLDALEIDAAILLEDYKEKYGDFIKQIADEGTFFSKEEIQGFFDLSLPGMDELMALIKIIDILEENSYDILVLDTAPTGHTIRLLELPDLLTSYIKVLAEMRQKHRVVVSMMVGRYVKDKADKYLDKMYNDVERIKATLKADTTTFIPVTIPETMSVSETEDLIKVLENRGIQIKTIFINQVIQGLCDFCKAKKAGQEKYINEIKKRFSKYTIQEIPLLPYEIRNDRLEVLSKILFEKEYTIPKSEKKELSVISNFDSLTIKPSLEFLLFGGKGGVGKTSCAAATALHESKKKKVLLFSTDPAHSLSDSLSVPIGNKITSINDNLDAIEIDSKVLLDGFKARYKKEIHSFFNSMFSQSGRATIDAPYDRKVMEDLFDLSPPGLDEIMAFESISKYMDEKTYDLFILDTAPTGHALRLLEIPEMAEEWVSTLLDIQEKYPIELDIGDTLNNILKTIKDMKKILENPEKTEFIVVTIPEAMALLETQDLISGLKRLKVPVKYVIINKIFPKTSCSFCSAKMVEESGYIKKLQELKLKTVGVELFPKEIQGEDLNKLGSTLFKG